ncbi:MAG: nucleoside transporter C-terminal domain-containing protein [Candidatus Marinimicrobia bacterium]|nr:nucleoside transporter C-terminal domain-containing protein [Candidatus Neomarinimicrobiota bacterium]MDX9777427.1 nucleoside transporter C-terminal domain-containing protein [bacterium]
MNFTGLLGILVILLLAWGLSKDRRVINWRVVAWGIGLQTLFALFIFVVPAGSKIFLFINKVVVAVLSCASAGTEFVFGALAIGPGKPGSLGYFFAFQAMPSIVFFAALVGVLYYLGIMQVIIKGFAWVFTKLMRISGAESLSASSNIFVGVESSLIIKPYLATMTKSELNTVLTVGMATVASSMLAVYIMVLQHQFPTIAGHLVSASIMNAPAAIVISKLLYPEKDKPETLGLKIQPHFEKQSSMFESILDSAQSGVKLVVGIVAMLLAFLGLVALVDKIMVLLGIPLNGLFSSNIDFSLKGLLGYLFFPMTWLIGIPAQDVSVISGIIGERVILSEVTAFQDLSNVIAQGLITQRSAVITTYALTGFAHIASIAVFVGGYAALAPKRARDLSGLGFRALLGATLATLLTASIAGIFYQNASILAM